jgi:hypothetical protein
LAWQESIHVAEPCQAEKIWPNYVNQIAAMSSLFNRMLQLVWDDLCSANKAIFLRALSSTANLPLKNPPSGGAAARPS